TADRCNKFCGIAGHAAVHGRADSSCPDYSDPCRQSHARRAAKAPTLIENSNQAAGSGTGAAPEFRLNGKFVCQMTKSAPSTSPSPLASPMPSVASPELLGKLVCQMTKSAPSTLPSPLKSPATAGFGTSNMDVG